MSYDFSPDQPNPGYNPNYKTPKPKSDAEKVRAAKARAATFEKRKPPQLSKMREAAEEMEHESSYKKKPCRGLFS